MRNSPANVTIGLLAAMLWVQGCGLDQNHRNVQPSRAGYQDLLVLFEDFRNFQNPAVVDGVPDYTAAAMEARKRGIPEFRDRLAAIDPGVWPIPQQVDYRLVEAEINGLEFDHDVLRPWSRDPCFYTVINAFEPDVPAREGPEVFGALCLSDWSFPLSEKDSAEFQIKLAAIPEILEQAKNNLTEDAADLWSLAIRDKKRERFILDRLAERLSRENPELAPLAERAGDAVDGFRAWLEEKQTGLSAPSGIGIEHFNRYMKKVHLVPYTWEDQMRILRRELDRALTFLRLERQRNRRLPELEPAATKEELQRRYREQLAYFFNFLRESDIFSVHDYMRLSPEYGGFIPPDQPRDYFVQVEYRDFLPLRCHSVHWLEKQREKTFSHPIRSAPLLFNIWDSRAEGFATGFEEWMLQAGLFDENPRARELVYNLLAFRAVRGIAGLKMHANQFSLEEAVKFAVDHTPGGWVLPDGNTIWTDMKIYLHQPGYGTSYIIGKVHIEKLMAERMSQQGGDFRLKDFFDEFFLSGMIPVSMIRWEMTGLEDELGMLR